VNVCGVNGNTIIRNSTKLSLFIAFALCVLTPVQTIAVNEGASKQHPAVVPVKGLKLELKEATQIASSTTIEAQPTSASSGDDIETIVRQAARKYGIDEEHFVSIAACESRFNPNAVNYGYNENGYPSGLFQHLSGYWPKRAAQYGWAGASVFDAQANAEVTAQMFRDGLSYLWECR
jgi:Tfp pilus assembly major pilin PilA